MSYDGQRERRYKPTLSFAGVPDSDVELKYFSGSRGRRVRYAPRVDRTCTCIAMLYSVKSKKSSVYSRQLTGVAGGARKCVSSCIRDHSLSAYALKGGGGG